MLLSRLKGDTSVKPTGPSYAKDSKKEDGVYLDRVVFLECERKNGAESSAK